ncbi:hypothetical protein [Methylorubrum thiocyanatum]|uniref:hypothetical protein n=1 Tax=Methylorubrum thiocyanatum TaxID=47958 RepID=UPI003654BB61
MSAIPPDASPFAGVADFSVPLTPAAQPDEIRRAPAIDWRLVTAAAIGLPLHYAGRTRLGAPVIRWLLRTLARYA